jgi:TonB-dependent SusC/RagA subfamily outer membrane receptor
MRHVLRSSHRWILTASVVGFAIACARPQKASPVPAEQGGSAAKVEGSTKTLAQLFEGKFPGVAVTAVPGGVRLVIRNAQYRDGSPAYPLYVIDNNPIAAPDGVLSINPNDVAKIEILKDDASTLIWGERAANGVVKITTRRK